MIMRVILISLVASAALCAVAARAQIFVENFGNGDPGMGRIAEYTTSGALVNPTLISGLTSPGGITLSGDKLFVANLDTGSDTWTIREYTTSGVLVNRSLISGLNGSYALAVSGGFLYVVTGYVDSDAEKIGKYTTSGATVNATLIGQLGGVGGIAVRGNNLFVSEIGVDEYTTSGSIVKPGLVSGLPFSTGAAISTGIALSGDNLFLGSFNFDTQTGTIGEYTTSGATVNATLISGPFPFFPGDLAVSGGDLFVTNFDAGTIGKYDAATGATINSALVSGLNGPEGIAVVSASVPDASSTWTLLLLGLTGIFSLNLVLRQPA
jgi:hypothetical protein